MSTAEASPAYEQGSHITPTDKKPTGQSLSVTATPSLSFWAVNTDVPATQGEASGLSHNTHVPQSSTSETAPVAAAAPAPHTPTKAEQKEQKNYEKLIAKDEKHEAKNLKDATKASRFPSVLCKADR